MKNYGRWMKTTGGVWLFLLAMASDGGMLGLLPICLLAGLAMAMIAGGVLLSRPVRRHAAAKVRFYGKSSRAAPGLRQAG